MRRKAKWLVSLSNVEQPFISDFRRVASWPPQNVLRMKIGRVSCGFWVASIFRIIQLSCLQSVLEFQIKSRTTKEEIK